MCVVSAVHQEAQTWPLGYWNRDTFAEYQEIIRRLDAIDKALGLPDCGAEAKEKFVRDMAARLGVSLKASAV